MNIKCGDIVLKAADKEQHSVIRFLWKKKLVQMQFTLRCIQCMVTSILRDQKYMFGVRSLLVVEVLLMRNDLAALLFQSPMQ